MALAGVLLLVIFPQPVDLVEEDTDGASCCDDDIEAGAAWSFGTRCLLDCVALRFSLDNLVWLVLARGVEREARLELLLGVLGTAKSSSWKPLKRES